jgi:hypothetical protein
VIKYILVMCKDRIDSVLETHSSAACPLGRRKCPYLLLKLWGGSDEPGAVVGAFKCKGLECTDWLLRQNNVVIADIVMGLPGCKLEIYPKKGIRCPFDGGRRKPASIPGRNKGLPSLPVMI